MRNLSYTYHPSHHPLPKSGKCVHQSGCTLGKSIALIPSDAEISTQQAAEILKVSKPYIVKLLEQGEIPYRKIGSHRRLQLKDVLDYEAKLKVQRRKNLDFLASEAQELNMGYE
ncbi:MAG: excisionase family DNA-binding protein [Chitinophagales bacterium]